MGPTQGGLFCAIVQLMRTIKTSLLIAVLAATPAMAQQPAAKTTEQQARSYIASAFITGAAPLILSDDVVLQPELRTKLALPTDANSRTVYQALINLTNGKAVQVRPAIRDEVLKSQVLAAPGKPVFALEAGTTTLVLQYDLERDNVAFVGQPAAIAAASAAPQAQAQAQAPAANPEAAPGRRRPGSGGGKAASRSGPCRILPSGLASGCRAGGRTRTDARAGRDACCDDAGTRAGGCTGRRRNAEAGSPDRGAAGAARQAGGSACGKSAAHAGSGDGGASA